MFFQPNTLYLDPSVMTYAIQAVAGIVIAVGAAAVIIFRKAKKKVAEKLNLEEKSIKETEEDVVLVDNESADN